MTCRVLRNVTWRQTSACGHVTTAESPATLVSSSAADRYDDDDDDDAVEAGDVAGVAESCTADVKLTRQLLQQTTLPN